MCFCAIADCNEHEALSSDWAQIGCNFGCIRVSDIYCSAAVLILLWIDMVTRIIKHTEETIHVLFHLFHDGEIETPVMLVNLVVMLCDVLKFSSLLM